MYKRQEQKTYEVQLLADVELSSSDRWNDSRRRATTEFIRHSNRFSNSQTLTTSPSFLASEYERLFAEFIEPGGVLVLIQPEGTVPQINLVTPPDRALSRVAVSGFLAADQDDVRTLFEFELKE